jgi:hypothetical protein
MKFDLTGFIQGAAQGVPAGAQLGGQIRAKKEQEQRMELQKLETATSMLKDPNVPDGFKVNLWNKAVAPAIQKMYPSSGTPPAITEWSDGLKPIATKANGIFKGWREGKYTAPDAQGMLAELATGLTTHLAEGKAMTAPFSEIIAKDEAQKNKLTLRKAGIAGIPDNTLVNLRGQIGKQLEVASAEELPDLQNYLRDVDGELMRRGARGPGGGVPPPAATPSFATPDEAQKALAAGKIKPGQKITVGGRPAAF